jgi:hypothetical protein
MKRIAIAVCVVVLVLAVVARAQTPAPKPGPEHKKVGVFVGHWTYEAEYKAGPLGPAGKATGVYNAQWVLGGFFVQGQWVEKGASGETRGIETYGYDPLNKNYAQSMYQDDGTIGSGAMTGSENIWNYEGAWVIGGKKYMVKVTFTLAADLMSFTQKGDISADGNSWTPWLEAKYTKVPKPAPKK